MQANSDQLQTANNAANDGNDADRNAASLNGTEAPVYVYHERQSLQMCALHSINNLLQRKSAVTKKELDDICREFSPDTWMNPHKSVLGLGNYDVNIVMEAVRRNGYETVWFDKRKDLHSISPDHIFGFIVNTPKSAKGLWLMVQTLLSGKHWFTVRKLGRYYYNLDSVLTSPEVIGETDQELIEFLQQQLNETEAQLLLVVTDEVMKIGSWQAAAT